MVRRERAPPDLRMRRDERRRARGNPYEIGLEKNAANHVPLTPLTFLERSASVFPDRLAVVHGPRSFTWSQTYARCRRLASALAGEGIGKGDTIAVMLDNIPRCTSATSGSR